MLAGNHEAKSWNKGRTEQTYLTIFECFLQREKTSGLSDDHIPAECVVWYPCSAMDGACAIVRNKLDPGRIYMITSPCCSDSVVSTLR